MIRIKRVYEEPQIEDGYRVLLDRLWPRGLRKEEARIDAWLRDLAVSDGLRRWFGHDPARWEGFRIRYREELSDPAKRPLLEELARRSREGVVTILFAAKEGRYNNAAVLKEVLEEMVGRLVPP